ncbi:hypothetical protein EE612_058328 [Oryza sativa]|nr:hypothetical protein EE612_058328 [Oryza sativa]
MDNARESEDEHCLYAQELVFAYNRSMVLRAAIQLGLLDALAAGDDADHRRARRENPGHGRRRGGSDSPVPRVLRRGEVLNRDEPRRWRGSDPALHAGAGVPVAHQEQRRGVAGSILHVYYRRRPPIALATHSGGGGERRAGAVREDPRDALPRVHREEQEAGRAVRPRHGAALGDPGPQDARTLRRFRWHPAARRCRWRRRIHPGDDHPSGISILGASTMTCLTSSLRPHLFQAWNI